MNQYNHKIQLIEAWRESLATGTCVKATLSNYHGQEAELKNIYVKSVVIKGEEYLSFTYRYLTRDQVKNCNLEEAMIKIEATLAFEGFRSVSLFTIEADLHYDLISADRSTLKRKAPTHTAPANAEHDRPKHRLIAAEGKKYLTELGISDAQGKVYKNAQDKYRQINHYIEILRPLLETLPHAVRTRVVDMGSGKGYLTFALYDYMTSTLHRDTDMTGVEYRQDMVDLCAGVAVRSGFAGLRFVQGSIDSYGTSGTNLLIALHACDTATDDAIAAGIRAEADLIVVAPCCHKQIRREIESAKVKNGLDYLTRYGILMERQAEMVTDGIRALILEYYGYSTRVFEFISDAHTPKNVMIVGMRNERLPKHSAALLQKIKDAKAYFGIGYHHLERVMGL